MTACVAEFQSGHLVWQYLKIVGPTRFLLVIVRRTGNKSHAEYCAMYDGMYEIYND